jgi:hypothetical protein
MFLWENPPTSLVTEIPVEPPTFDYTPSEGESFLRMIVPVAYLRSTVILVRLNW